MNTTQAPTHVSAGGVVYRRMESQVEVLLISVGAVSRWQLPKGMVDPGETVEAAARREVREEGGVETELVAPLDTIEYWYYASQGNERIRVHKYVHFYLFEYVSGDPANHDHEVNEACWVEISQALEKVRFESEKRILRLARDLIREAGIYK